MASIPSLSIWILAWIFLVIGLVSLTIIVIYTKYGREVSVRLSIISVVVASIFLGFSFHFFLLSWGL